MAKSSLENYQTACGCQRNGRRRAHSYSCCFPTPDKRLEVCAEVRSFGAALLSALEKNDAEALSLLGATQEVNLLQAVLNVKQSQIDEANQNLAALQASQSVTQGRQQYYQGLLSAGPSSFETTQVSELKSAQDFQGASEIVEIASSIIALIPTSKSGTEGCPGPAATLSIGGVNIAQSLAAASRVLTAIASLHSYHANMASIQSVWDRRSQEWTFQAQNAGKELTQIQNQINAATFRVTMAETDYT